MKHTSYIQNDHDPQEINDILESWVCDNQLLYENLKKHPKLLHKG